MTRPVYYGQLGPDLRRRVLRAARVRLHLTNIALAARLNVTEYAIQSFLRNARRKGIL